MINTDGCASPNLRMHDNGCLERHIPKSGKFRNPEHARSRPFRIRDTGLYYDLKTMSDTEAQEDELLVLASIYDENAFSSSSQDNSVGGQFCASPDLPANLTVYSTTKDGQQQKHTVKHLPPIMLHFQMPHDYPSSSPPTFTLAAKWLNQTQLGTLCQRLDQIWEENKGEVILFLWTNFLKEEILSFLDIESSLNLDQCLPLRRKSSVAQPCVLVKDPIISDPSSEGDVNCDKTDASLVDSAPVDPRGIQELASPDMLLPIILDHDRQQREVEFTNTLFTCNVCFVEKLGSLCMRFTDCDHVYCKDCMRGFFEVQIAEGNVLGLTCPSSKCQSQAHQAQVKELMRADEFERYDRLLLQTSLDTMGDVVYCPRPSCGCGVLVDSTLGMGSCSACNHVFCVYCKGTYHGVSPCRIKSEEVKQLRDAYLAADAAERKRLEQRYGRQVKNIIEESYSNDWLEQYSKQCPHCKTHIQKIDGCNKMTCTKCRSYFCWLCGASLHRNNPYHHFSNPTSDCFNRLFQGLGDAVIEDDDPNWDPMLI